MFPTFIFRGTTINYAGNRVSMTLPCTCTSAHPVKALLFSLECMTHNPPEKAVIYIAQFEKFKALEKAPNVLSHLEDEIVFEIRPLDFYKQSEGYIPATDLQQILVKYDIYSFFRVRKDNLSRLLTETADIPPEVIAAIAQDIHEKMKKNK